MIRQFFSDPFAVSGQGYPGLLTSVLFNSSMTPFLLIIGGFLLLGVAKLIDAHEHSSKATAALLEHLLEKEKKHPSSSSTENESSAPLSNEEREPELIDEPFQENERKYWKG
jgi:hypothetical protein